MAPALSTQTAADRVWSVITLQRTYYLTDVLLLYTFLVLIAGPVLASISRGGTWFVLAASWCLWFVWQLHPDRAQLPWPIADNTAFPFAAWQVYFFTALFIGYHRRALLTAWPRCIPSCSRWRRACSRPLHLFLIPLASWSALQQAADISGAVGGTLTIAHVVQPRVSSFDGASTMLRALKGGLEEGWNLLASASGSVRSAKPPHLEVLSGDPVEAIVDYASELDADLIVVGSHKRGRLERFLVGSVSDGIVRRATMPVLVVPLKCLGSPLRPHDRLPQDEGGSQQRG